ncbi:hypothetical protein AOQ84DRAFT_121155 [Glonium stellatum]|uniref:Uncharacterized protein n=1 Tax=Glonium stellatum TaxID=574774 RepID=A0A8E2JZU4_9PEZI|nr:hypothetical protein AOQ84DRAFT_121155 [Glonium stellatum]
MFRLLRSSAAGDYFKYHSQVESHSVRRAAAHRTRYTNLNLMLHYGVAKSVSDMVVHRMVGETHIPPGATVEELPLSLKFETGLEVVIERLKSWGLAQKVAQSFEAERLWLARVISSDSVSRHASYPVSTAIRLTLEHYTSLYARIPLSVEEKKGCGLIRAILIFALTEGLSYDEVWNAYFKYVDQLKQVLGD